MKLISDIVEALSNGNTSTQAALLKAQVLAHTLGNQDLGRWVENELRGYPDDAEVPPYRLLPLTVVGHVTNGYYHYSNQTLPTGHLPEQVRDSLTRRKLRESVSTLESWIGQKHVAAVIPAEACHLLSEAFTDTYFVQQAWGRFGVGAIEQVLVQFRSRLLEFCLQISDQMSSPMTTHEARKKARALGANEIFRNAVFGDNATIVVQGGSIRDVHSNVVKNDWASLVTQLGNAGISKEDIQSLESAIGADKGCLEHKGKSLGPRVRDWLGSMVAKAGTASWDVSIAAAGNLLATALQDYYGFGR